jgi:hypothetical protein
MSQARAGRIIQLQAAEMDALSKELSNRFSGK